MRSIHFVLFLLPVPALAQGTERFQLERTENGYVRLNTETGAVSSCTEENGQLVCRMAADERAAMERETDDLTSRLDALEKRVAALEARGALSLPTEGDVERTLGLMERFLRGFAGIARNLGRDSPSDEPAPDRTALGD